MTKILTTGLIFSIFTLVSTIASANCTIIFGDAKKTYPISVNLKVDQATLIRLDKKNIPASSFIRSTKGPCAFTVFNKPDFKGHFVTIGTDLKSRIRIGTDGVRYRDKSVKSTLSEIAKQANKDLFRDLVILIGAPEHVLGSALGDTLKSAVLNRKQSNKYYSHVTRTKGIITGGNTWRGRSVIIKRVPTTCKIIVGGNKRSMTYYGVAGDKINSIPAVDFVRKTSRRCSYRVYNETGFRKKSNNYNGGINSKKKVGYRMRSLEFKR